MQRRPLIWFATDYGLDDPFVGICHTVIAQLAPAARVIDLAHGIVPGNVRQGAALLADTVPWLRGGVLLAVVDPGVGTTRRPVIVACREQEMLLVGPDNGLLAPAASRLGGVREAVEVRVPLPGVAPPTGTFDGRDVFAPAAALLAAGATLDSLGTRIAGDTLIVLRPPGVTVGAGHLRAEVLQVDRFGNVQLSATPADLRAAGLADAAAVAVARGAVRVPAQVVATFAAVDAGEVALLPDAWGRLQVAINRGNAARLLHAAAGDEVTVSG